MLNVVFMLTWLRRNNGGFQLCAVIETGWPTPASTRSSTLLKNNFRKGYEQDTDADWPQTEKDEAKERFGFFIARLIAAMDADACHEYAKIVVGVRWATRDHMEDRWRWLVDFQQLRFLVFVICKMISWPSKLVNKICVTHVHLWRMFWMMTRHNCVSMVTLCCCGMTLPSYWFWHFGVDLNTKCTWDFLPRSERRQIIWTHGDQLFSESSTFYSRVMVIRWSWTYAPALRVGQIASIRTAKLP